MIMQWLVTQKCIVVVSETLHAKTGMLTNLYGTAHWSCLTRTYLRSKLLWLFTVTTWLCQYTFLSFPISSCYVSSNHLSKMDLCLRVFWWILDKPRLVNNSKLSIGKVLAEDLFHMKIAIFVKMLFQIWTSENQQIFHKSVAISPSVIGGLLELPRHELCICVGWILTSLKRLIG